MISLSPQLNGSLSKIKELIKRYKLSEFIISAFVYETICIVVMAGVFAYGLDVQSREIITFTAFNGITSFCLFLFILWMTTKAQLPDHYYSWSTAINYGAAILLLPYALFIDHKAMIAISMIFFFVNIFNLCVLLHILNFRSNYSHDWSALRKLTTVKNHFKFKLSMGHKLNVIMPNGFVTIYFDTLSFNGVDYDLYHLTKYFETHDLDLYTATDDDFKLFEMIRY